MCICIFLERFEFLNEEITFSVTAGTYLITSSLEVRWNRVARSKRSTPYFLKAATNIGILYKAYNLRLIRLGARTMWTNRALGIKH